MVKKRRFETTAQIQSIKRQDEIGSLISSFKELGATLQQQHEQVSEQKEQLEIAARQEADRNLLNKAQAGFERMMAGRGEGLGQMTDKLLSELIKFLSLQQGAIYIRQKSEAKPAEYLEW